MTEVPFKNLTIGGFRGLRELELEACGPVNLLVGGNNSGKTSILEALLLLSGPMEVEQWEAAIALRGSWPFRERLTRSRSQRVEALTWLFPREAGRLLPISIRGEGARRVRGVAARAEWVVGEPPEQPVATATEMIEASRAPDLEGPQEGLSLELELDVHTDTVQRYRMLLWRQARSLRLAGAPRSASWPVVFANPISHRSDTFLISRVGRLIRNKRKEQALVLLRALDENIVDLVIVSPDGNDATFFARGQVAELHVEHTTVGLVPVHAMGDGTRRAIHLAALLADVGPGGVLLVDELEVGMHASVLRDVFRWLWHACETAKVQLFATTHSLEAVDCILEAVPDRDLVLYRLEGGKARRFDGETLRMARVELGQEVR